MPQHPGTQDAEELCLSSHSCDWWIQNVNFHNPGELRTGNHCLMLSVAQVPESLGSRLRERASILQSSLASSSLAVLLSPLLLALLLSSPKTYSPATAGSHWAVCRASPGCRGSAQPRWLLVAHFHDHCSFHCNLHPNTGGTRESSKRGWNETRSLLSPVVYAHPTTYPAIMLPWRVGQWAEQPLSFLMLSALKRQLCQYQNLTHSF